MKRLCFKKDIKKRAENGTRTRDPNLGKVVLYQLSYFRKTSCQKCISLDCGCKGTTFFRTTKTFPRFFEKKVLIHAISVVFIAKSSKNFNISVLMKHSNGRMSDTIKHTSFYRRVVNHILKNYLFAHF